MGSTRFALQYATINGHRRAFVKAGSGPVLLLLHGLGCDHHTWDSVIAPLARHYTVIAPDLLGHGASDKPRADYSVGGYANGMRDLLTLLGINRVTVVGHSFGGGVAMQFFYQYPDLIERLILVSPGGVGRSVTPLIRAITVPGFNEVMGIATLPGLRQLGTGTLRGLARTGLPHTRDLGEVADIFEQLAKPDSRSAIRHVVSAVVDWRGQIVTMINRSYLLQMVPLCVIWGTEDDVIPCAHAAIVAEHAPAARIELIEGAGHFPQRDHGPQFCAVIDEFMTETRPGRFSRARWAELLHAGNEHLTLDELEQETADAAT